MELWFLSHLWLLLFLAKGQAWVIQTNEDLVTPGSTPKVELVCHQGNNNNNALEATAETKNNVISSIRIIKQGLFGNKITFVQIRAGNDKEYTKEGDDVIVTGEIKQDGASFLKVKWQVASHNTPGAYGCEIDTHDSDDNMVCLHANPILIREKFLTMGDVNKLILSATSECEKKQQALKLEISQLKAFIGKELNAKERQISDVKEELASEISDINENIKSKCTTKKEVSFQISSLCKSTLNKMMSDRSHSSHHQKSCDDLNSTVFKLRNDITKKIDSVEKVIKSTDVHVDNITDFFTEQVKRMHQKLDLCCPSHFPTTVPTTTPGRPSSGGPVSSSPRWSTPASPTSNTSHISSDQWPCGKYTMVKPRVGCPESDGGKLIFYTIPYKLGSFVDNVDGLYKVFLQSAGYDDAPLKFCCRSTDSSIKAKWPKGSYCIGKSFTSCPEGFSEGEMTRTIMSENSNGEAQPVGTYKQIYCCRSDGQANVPLSLPTRDPFYMYRYEGECQKVQYMDVQEDTIITRKSNGVTDTLASTWTTPDVDSDGNVIVCRYFRPS